MSDVRVTSPLLMDSTDQNLGNSPGADSRGRIHVFIANKDSEPLPVNFSGTITVHLNESTDSVQVYGNDGTDNQPIKTNAAGQIEIGNFPTSFGASQSGAWSVGRTWTLDSLTDSVAVSFPGSMTVTQGTSPWVVSGTVSVSNFPATQPVSGTVTANQGGAWSVGRTWTLDSLTDSIAVSFPGSMNVTQGTSPWVVSGTVSVGNFPLNQQTMSNSLPVAIASDQTGLPRKTAIQSASLDAITTTMLIATAEYSSLRLEIRGAWNGDVAFEQSIDGVNYWPAYGLIEYSPTSGATLNGQISNSAANGVDCQGAWRFDVSNVKFLRLTAVGGSAGTAACQVSLSTSFAALLGILSYVLIGNQSPILVDGSSVTQPISGSVGRTWSLNSGTDSVAVSFPASLAVTQSTSPWVVSGTVSVSNFPATQSVTQGTSPWVVSGTIAATQSGAWTTGRTWTLSSATDSVNVGNFPATQPVSGTVTAAQSGTWTVQPGNTQNTTPWLVKPHDGTNGATIKAANDPADSNDTAIVVDKRPNRIATYTATASFTVPATPTDILTIAGSGSKIVRILRIEINTTQTTAGLNKWFLIKRSAANSGGTSASQTAVSHNSADPASTAVVKAYTANATSLGAAVGTLRESLFLGPALTSVFQPGSAVWDFDSFEAQGIVLNGVAEFLAINFSGAALPSGFAMVSISITWSEE